MTRIKASLIEREVERLFDERPPIYKQVCQAPVTDALYFGGYDSVEPQIEAARRALLAREWWYVHGPAELQPLPLSPAEQDAFHFSGTLIGYVFHLFVRSLEARKYDVKEHPHFADYVSGVLWETARPDSELATLPNYGESQLAQLKRRFPPRQIAGLGPGLYWYPPKEHADIMNLHREGQRRRQQIADRIAAGKS